MKATFHLLVLPFLAAALQGAPTMSHVTVTDVSAKAFRVVWNASASAEPLLEVFTNAAGTAPAPGLITEVFPGSRDDDLVSIVSAELGILSIEASNLQPDTLYYFRARTRSLVDGTVASAPLQSIRTAAQTGLAMAAPLAAFANPIVRFEGVTEDGRAIDSGAVITASVPGARTPVSAVVLSDSTVLLDLNNLVAHATGTNLRVSEYDPLTIRVFRGVDGSETFHFFTPASDALAALGDPYLTQGPLVAPVLKTRSGSDGLRRVFMEFPVEAGRFYAVERNHGLAAGGWVDVSGGLRSSGARFFWEDNGTAEVEPFPEGTTRLFYRLREVPLGPTAP